jgi:poly(3-hydroxybutyrate) depolymerase
MMKRIIKNILLLIFLCLIIIPSHAQDYCIPHRFVDNNYFRSRDIQVEKNIEYGQAENYKGKTEILDLDILYPSADVDTMKKRPLIMLVHGGSKGDNEKMEKYCPLFAQRGFVVCNINRRKGRKNNESAEMLKEAYRNIQDAYAALRFLVSIGQKYGIDTSAIFVGGVSAGALTVIGMSYMDQTDFDNHFPDITEALGRIDHSTNDIKTTFTIRGVIDMWGQIPDTSSISPREAGNIPVIIFHSTADSSLSPYEKALQLASRYEHLGGCYQLHTSTGTGHTEGISKYYIAQQTGCFLKSILCNSCKSFSVEVDNENISCKSALPFDRSAYHRPHIKLDSSVISRYAGIYKTNGRKIEIVSGNGHLFLMDTQNGTKAELYPESENDFFMEEDNIQFAFNRNKKGKVDELTFFIDAQEIKAKKIK